MSENKEKKIDVKELDAKKLDEVAGGHAKQKDFEEAPSESCLGIGICCNGD